MQNLKRVLSLVLVVAMLASFTLSASAATGEQLTDLSESNFQPEVRVLNALGIVEGYEDGTYKPAQDVTRAELALILARVRVGGDKDMIATYNYGHMTYTDVLANGYVWAASGIQYATDNGMVVGDGNGLYRPGDTVTIVEGLKMLLTALGYSAEIEGLQNVGAAWKANTLSLADEVGLLDRFYGDTNKNMTRDDMALLIYNFLMSDVVKGYFENDVANVDTIMYVGGTALEIYFGKQVIYGVVVANEVASLDLYDYALDGRVDDDNADDNYGRLNRGFTQLYLYEDDENGYTLRDYLTQANRREIVMDARNPWTAWEDALDEVFVTVRLTTGLAELGESVFVITDLEPVKGNFVAVGDLCFDTGVNEVGVEQWTAPNVAPLTDRDETIYVNDYDIVCEGGLLLGSTNLGDNKNGDFYKTVDFDGDGVLDFVMVENWGMVNVSGTKKSGAVVDSDVITDDKDDKGDFEWTTAWNIYANMAAEPVTFGMVNFHYADGLYYTVAADTLSKLTLADSKDAVNFKNGYITLSDDNQYYQSNIWNFSGKAYDNIMDCEKDPYNLKSYTWYLDCGGFIRAYGADATVYDGMYLLTDATSTKTGRSSWDKTVDTYKESSEKVNYTTVDHSGKFIPNVDMPYGDALATRAIENEYDGFEAVTNLAAGIAADTSIALEDVSVLGNTIIELRDVVDKNTYSTTDDWGHYGYHNTNNGGKAAELVYTTTDTDYYYVVLGTYNDGKGDVEYVKSVEYFDGYLNVKNFDFDACEVAYAAATLEKGSNDEYWYANAVVFETYENTVNVEAPYFAYEHVSSYKDYKSGIYNVINPTGEPTTYDVNDVVAKNILDAYGALGFYSYDLNTGVATQIVEDWADYGISAHTIAVDKTGAVDYYVLDYVGNPKQIKVTEDTPVYSVMNPKNDYAGKPYWDVKAYDAKLAQNDKIILVENAAGIQYILVVYAPYYDLGRETWSEDAQDLWKTINENGFVYGTDVLVNNFIAAVNAMTLAQANATLDLQDLFDAELNAFMELVDAAGIEGILTAENAELTEALAEFLGDVKIGSEKLDLYIKALLATVEFDEEGVVTGKIVIDPYLYDFIQDSYNALTETKKVFLSWLVDKAETVVNETVEDLIDSVLENLPLDIELDISIEVSDLAVALLKAYVEIPEADIELTEQFIETAELYYELLTNEDNDAADNDSYLVETELIDLYKKFIALGYAWEVDGKVDDAVSVVMDVLEGYQAAVIVAYNEGTKAEFDAAWAAWQALGLTWVDFGTTVEGENANYTNDEGAYDYIVANPKW